MSRTSSTAVPTTTTPPSSSRRCPARSSTGSGPVTRASRSCTSTQAPSRGRRWRSGRSARWARPSPSPVCSPSSSWWSTSGPVGSSPSGTGPARARRGARCSPPRWARAREGTTWSTLFTPLLGLCMGLSLLLVGVGLVLFTKKLLPHETAAQDKHDGSHFDRVTSGATLVGGWHNSGLARRKLITRSLALMGGGVGLMLLMPLGGLIKNPNRNDPLGTTNWAKGVRLVRNDGSPIRPGDQEPGSLETVFPAVTGGNIQADSATMLIRRGPEQVEEAQPRKGQAGWGYGDYVAYSKICTH